MGRRKRNGKTLTTHVVARWCPNCFHNLDAVTSMEGEHVPKVGDFTVCINCTSVLCFTENMELRLSSLLEIPTHSRLAFAKVVQLTKMYGPRKDGSRYVTN